MSYPVYYVPAGDVLPVLFDTFDGGTGASVTMTGLAVTDIEIYKDGGTTQRASDAGYTLLDTDGIDFDGVTGIHGFSIDTGDNTDSGFYAVGSWYHVVVSSVTVDSQTVNFIACAFRIMVAESVAGAPKVDVHAISADTTAADNAELMFDGTGYAGGTTKLDVNVASIAANAITATSINADAIEAAKIKDGAITAAKIADAAIDAATFAADVDAEIATMIWNAATASYGGAGTYGQAVEDILADTNELQGDDYPTSIAAVKTVVDAVQAKTDLLTFEAVTNHIEAAVQNIAADAIDATAIKNDAITAAKIAAAAIDNATFAADVCVVANVKKINNTTLTGDGGATPWGPA